MEFSVDDFPQKKPRREWRAKVQIRSSMTGVAQSLEKLEVAKRIKPEEKIKLERTGFYHFLLVHNTPQSVALIQALLPYWKTDRGAFKIGGKWMSFSPDEVAIITGLPNRGKHVPPILWSRQDKSQSQNICFHGKAVTGKDLIECIQVSLDCEERTGEDSLVKFIIWYILGCLIFTGNEINVIADDIGFFIDNVDEIGEYNWASAIHAELKGSLDKMAKIKQHRLDHPATPPSFGYFQGFAYVLQFWALELLNLAQPSHPDLRPRMLRWNFIPRRHLPSWENFFSKLTHHDVYDVFVGMTDNEKALTSIGVRYTCTRLDCREEQDVEEVAALESVRSEPVCPESTADLGVGNLDKVLKQQSVIIKQQISLFKQQAEISSTLKDLIVAQSHNKTLLEDLSARQENKFEELETRQKTYFDDLSSKIAALYKSSCFVPRPPSDHASEIIPRPSESPETNIHEI